MPLYRSGRVGRLMLAVLLAVVLLAAACGDDDSGGSSAGGGEGSNEPPVKIGHWAPLSGTAASNGEFESNGVELAIQQVNDEGGILDGRTIELVQYDDAGAPEQSVSVVQRLLDQDQVEALVGGILSTNTLAVRDVAADRTLMFVTAAKAPDITVDGPSTLFRIDSTLITDTAVMDEYLQENPEALECSKIYMIAEDSDYGKGNAGLYKSYWDESGNPEVVALDYYPFQNTDFTTILTKVRDSEADCLYVNGNIGEMTALLQQIDTVGIDLPIFAATSNISQPMVTNSGPAIEGIVSGDVYVSTLDNPENNAFVEAYSAEYGQPPERQAAMGYATMRILLAAIDAAGSTDPEAVAEVIRSQSWDTVFGPLSFDEEGQSDMSPIPITVEEGKVVPLS